MTKVSHSFRHLQPLFALELFIPFENSPFTQSTKACYIITAVSVAVLANFIWKFLLIRCSLFGAILYKSNDQSYNMRSCSVNYFEME